MSVLIDTAPFPQALPDDMQHKEGPFGPAAGETGPTYGEAPHAMIRRRGVVAEKVARLFSKVSLLAGGGAGALVLAAPMLPFAAVPAATTLATVGAAYLGGALFSKGLSIFSSKEVGDYDFHKASDNAQANEFMGGKQLTEKIEKYRSWVDTAGSGALVGAGAAAQLGFVASGVANPALIPIGAATGILSIINRDIAKWRDNFFDKMRLNMMVHEKDLGKKDKISADDWKKASWTSLVRADVSGALWYYDQMKRNKSASLGRGKTVGTRPIDVYRSNKSGLRGIARIMKMSEGMVPAVLGGVKLAATPAMAAAFGLGPLSMGVGLALLGYGTLRNYTARKQVKTWDLFTKSAERTSANIPKGAKIERH